MQNGVSVIVCCYNSEKRIPQTLRHLAVQHYSNVPGLEILLVDNNSTDHTAQTALETWQQLETSIPLRILNQPVPGLSAAREKGMEESRYDCILFCDDDNWLCADYVEKGYLTLQANSKIGILGGLGIPELEGPKPDWFDAYKHCYAVGKYNEFSGNITARHSYVYGAGMFVRKAAWQNLLSKGFSFLLSDRKGAKLSGGGDTEFCLAFNLSGYEIWLTEDISFRHFIPQSRVNLDYLGKLFSSAGSYFVYLDMYYRAIGRKENSLRIIAKECLKEVIYLLNIRNLLFLWRVDYRALMLKFHYKFHINKLISLVELILFPARLYRVNKMLNNIRC